MSPRRLEAEPLRDAILAVSGELALTRPTGTAVTLSGEGPATGLLRQTMQLDTRDFHRAVYLPVLRDAVLESLALFDFADPNTVVGERSATNVPAQGLYLLNSPFVQARADATATRLLAVAGNNRDRLQHAYVLLLGRPPTDREAQLAERFLSDYAERVAGDGIATGARP